MKRPSFQFYPADWLSDNNVMAMDATERGAYIHLLSTMWLTKDCSLDNNEEKLARIAQVDKVVIRSILHCFKVVNNRLYHERLNREIDKQNTYKKACSEAGKKGMKSRWGSQKNKVVITKDNSSSSSSSSSNNNNSKELQPTVEISDTEKKEYGNKDINGILTALKKYSGVQDFKESQQQQRRYANHFLNLLKGTKERAPVLPEEMRRRVEIIVSDSFKGKNCNSIRYLYGEVKGFIVESRSEPRIITGIKK